ncbi:LOW QUALITY PROTEIN: hypothetical protein T265_13879, partial [Opisthorchis viverrini]
SVCFICDRPVDEPEPLTGPCGTYHGGCFRCNGCRRILSYDRYKVIQAKLYCEPNCEAYMNGHNDVAQKIDAFKKERYSKEKMPAHRSKLIQKCPKCLLEIGSNEYVTALDRNYHRECLSCRHCNRVLLESQYKAIEDFPCCIPDCRMEREATSCMSCMYGLKTYFATYSTGSPKVPSEPASPRYLSLRRTPSPRPRSISVSLSKPGHTAENPKICVANPERVARLQRKLEEIQTMALEKMNCYVCGKKVYPAERLSILKRIYHKTENDSSCWVAILNCFWPVQTFTINFPWRNLAAKNASHSWIQLYNLAVSHRWRRYLKMPFTTRLGSEYTIVRARLAIRFIIGPRKPARNLLIHHLRSSRSRFELAEQLSTANRRCTGDENLDEVWRNVRINVLAEFSPVRLTSPMKPNDRWKSSRPQVVNDARKSLAGGNEYDDARKSLKG